jgi:uncharacterized protein
LCFKEYIALAERLLAAGADPNARNGAGATALKFAATFNQPDLIRRLLVAGADPAARDAQGHTALDLARFNGYAEAEAALTEGI